MNLKQILFFKFLFISNIMHCSDESNQFKTLSISNDPRLQLATKKDITNLWKKRLDSISQAEELNISFSRYVTKYNYCKDQNFLANLATFNLCTCSGIIALLSYLDNKLILGIFPATAFTTAAYKIRSLAKDYAQDQELLVRKCNNAFDKSDLNILRNIYTRTNQSKHLDFLNLVATRKEWITRSQQQN